MPIAPDLSRKTGADTGPELTISGNFGKRPTKTLSLAMRHPNAPGISVLLAKGNEPDKEPARQIEDRT